jgi:ketosteroid isomerase-like protein
MLAGAIVASVAAGACTMTGGRMDTTRDRRAGPQAVAALDTEYQAAVGRNDAETIERIHHENMILVLSNGTVVTGKQLEQRARDKAAIYERQVEVDDSQVVRVWGDTAVVTAKLWLKGTRSTGDAFDYKLWFSDTYVRTPTGLALLFGQAGAPLPK